MNSLLFITHEYPINRGDTAFIKSEILFLAEKFDKIYVLCLGRSSKNDNLLDMPKNVSISFIDYKHRKIKKFLLIFILLFYCSFYEEVFALIRRKKLSIHTLYLAMAFFLEAMMLGTAITKMLKHDKNINLIYTYWCSAETMGSLLSQKSNKNISCITRTHRYDLYEFRNKQNHQPYKSWMDKRITKIFFISRHGYDYYINTFAKSDLKKYSLARLGILNNHTIEEKKKNADVFTLISCSKIIPVKRINLIIEALGEIDDFKINWIHIGDGTDRNDIVSMADKILKSKENISYEFKGFMDNNQVMQFYKDNHNEIDCFISASESEGLPVSMMEAISFGIPVIATNVGGVPELVNSNTGILLSSEGTVSEIKKAIIDFYNFSDDRKNAMRQSARLLWETDFNAEINHKKFSEELLAIATVKSK